MENNQKIDFLFKYAICGPGGVGKSCLLSQFTDKCFYTEYNPTIGVEFGSKIITVDNKTIKVQFWDTAGQERFRSISKTYFRGAHGILLVYDVTIRKTFEAMPTWLEEAKSLDTVIMLIGNKTDLGNKREVLYQEGFQFAQNNNLFFIEISVKSTENLEDAIFELTHKVLRKTESNQEIRK